MTRPKPINFQNGARKVIDQETPLQSMQVGFRNEDESESGMPELLIFDVIGEDWWTGEGVTGKAVDEFCSKHAGKDIKVRINSGGGDVFEGLQIFNILVNFDGHVTGEIESLAFSAASFIAMAADTLKIHQAADFGIHMASVMTWGNKLAHQNQIEWLDRIDNQILAIYEQRGSVDRKELEALFKGTDNDGSLLSAEEALKHGFVDEIIPIPAKKDKSDTKDEGARTPTADKQVTVSFTNSVDSEVTIRHRRVADEVQPGEVIADESSVDVSSEVDASEQRLAELYARRQKAMAGIANRMRKERVDRLAQS